MMTDPSDLAIYLSPRGRVPGIGPEVGRAVRNGISLYRSPHGSFRFVFYDNGEPLSVLQAVSLDAKERAVIANVYTTPTARRRGLATKLLKSAQRRFKVVSHAKEQSLSEEGRAWRRGSARDERAVSYRTLRKLAKAKLDVTTSVLHDALLETFPAAYATEIEFAEMLANRDRRTHVVAFRPQALSSRHNPEYGTIFAVYEVRAIGFGPSQPISIRGFLHQLRRGSGGDLAITYVARPQRSDR